MLLELKSIIFLKRRKEN